MMMMVMMERKQFSVIMVILRYCLTPTSLFAHIFFFFFCISHQIQVWMVILVYVVVALKTIVIAWMKWKSFKNNTVFVVIFGCLFSLQL